MVDVRDTYGRVVFRVDGETIRDIGGRCMYTVRKGFVGGDRVYDVSGHWVAELRGERVYNTGGTWLGELRHGGTRYYDTAGRWLYTIG